MDTNQPLTHIPYLQRSKGVVLVNPATSYSRTLWSKLGPVIARLPQPFYTLGMIPIGLLLIDAGQVRLLSSLDSLPTSHLHSPPFIT